MTKFHGIIAGYNEISSGLGQRGVQLVIQSFSPDVPEDPLALLPFYWSGALVEITIDKWEVPDGDGGEEARTGQ